MICGDVFWLYGRLGRAAEQEWTERNATDWRTPCRKFLATPLECCMCVGRAVSSVLWRCWLGGRKGIRPVKNERWGAGMVICLERNADLRMAQLMPLPLTVSCFSKIQIGFTFLVPAHPGSPGQRAVKQVCVCVGWLVGRAAREPESSGFRSEAAHHWVGEEYVADTQRPGALPTRHWRRGRGQRHQRQRHWQHRLRDCVHPRRRKQLWAVYCTTCSFAAS